MFYVCANDCIIFRDTYAALKECPVCNAQRYKRNMIPCRRFQYLPMGPRLERLFGTTNLAQLVQAHIEYSDSILPKISPLPSLNFFLPCSSALTLWGRANDHEHGVYIQGTLHIIFLLPQSEQCLLLKKSGASFGRIPHM